jgi:hypothetical protein
LGGCEKVLSRQFLSSGFIPSKTMYQNVIEGLGLAPAEKAGSPVRERYSVANGSTFLLFVRWMLFEIVTCPVTVGSILPLLQCSSRIGRLETQDGVSFVAEARGHVSETSETTNMSKGGRERTSEIVRVGWEDLLVHS